MSPKKYWISQIQIHLVEYCGAEVSGFSEVPQFVDKLFFVFFKEVKLLCVRLIIECSRIQAKASTKCHFLRNYRTCVCM